MLAGGDSEMCNYSEYSMHTNTSSLVLFQERCPYSLSLIKVKNVIVAIGRYKTPLTFSLVVDHSSGNPLAHTVTVSYTSNG